VVKYTFNSLHRLTEISKSKKSEICNLRAVSINANIKGKHNANIEGVLIRNKLVFLFIYFLIHYCNSPQK